MTRLPDLLARNRAWAEQRSAADPDFFDELSAGQRPTILWIGCADSRVPPNEIVGLPPGELFVHRNIANLLPEDDGNATAVLQYAVDTLQVRHVIVCGHTGCGGVRAALGPALQEPLESWLAPLRALCRAHAEELDHLPDDETRWRRLCELNVHAQVAAVARLSIVRDAWRRGRSLALHGWIFELASGRIRDLDVRADGPPDDVQ